MCVFVCVFSSFLAFLGSFLALGAKRRAALFSVGLCVRFCLCFLFFSCFFGFLFWVLGALLLLFPSGFLCAFRFFFFLKIFALTFHKCQIVMKAILSFLFLDHFLSCFLKNFFHFCFDLPQVSNCKESVSFHFYFLPFFKVGLFLGSFLSLGAGRCAALFSVGIFVCVFVCVFSSFRAFLGSFLALGAGHRAALFSVWLFVCVFVSVFSSFRAFLGSWRPRGGRRLMTADWGLFTAAGEASDSGRGADYKGGKGL